MSYYNEEFCSIFKIFYKYKYKDKDIIQLIKNRTIHSFLIIDTNYYVFSNNINLFFSRYIHKKSSYNDTDINKIISVSKVNTCEKYIIISSNKSDIIIKDIYIEI
jgi:hypothetical protein